MKVTPKKHLGQHFLTDLSVSEKIALAGGEEQLKSETVIEIGPGTGALTQFLQEIVGDKLWLNEIDRESIAYLPNHFPKLADRIITTDFLQLDLSPFKTPIHIAGNFPYNISTQIVFRIIENKSLIHSMHGMFQKEVAARICAGPGSKVYGITSVLTQAFYHVEYLFDVPPNCFNPPPKVDSGVMRMWLKDNPVQCDVAQLFKVVKMAFGLRRKTLSNSLKPLGLTKEHPLAKLRPEALTVEQFESLVFELFPKK